MTSANCYYIHMKAIILAAGEGIRMRPLTVANPKPLLKVGKQTLLDQLVSNLPQRVDELIIVVGYLADQIKTHCGQKFYNRHVRYIHQPVTVKGTFAALKVCQPLIGKQERFFIFYADDLIDGESLRQCLRYRRAVVAAKVNNPERFGVIQLKPNGKLLRIIEKPKDPPTNLVLTNSMFLDYRIFDYYPGKANNGEEYLSLAIERMAQDCSVQVVLTQKWIPIGYPEDLKRAELLLK